MVMLQNVLGCTALVCYPQSGNKIDARILEMSKRERIILCTNERFTELYTSKLCNKQKIIGAKSDHLII